MANLVFPKVGTVNFLIGTAYVWTDVAKLTIHLYKNDLTPGPDTVKTDLVECDFSGYAGVTINAWDYAGTHLNAEGSAEVDATADVQWTRLSGSVNNPIYGYYVLGNTGQLMWIQRLDSPPFQMDTVGKTFTVHPRFTFRSQYGHP